MSRHPYKEFENKQTWETLRETINELIKNQDLELKTSEEYIIGFLCKKIKENNMGWKSTIDITREEAISAILEAQHKKSLKELTNEELEQMMYNNGIGDTTGLPYYGHNFNVVDSVDKKI